MTRPSEARRRFDLWAHRYDEKYGSDNSPLTYTLRGELPIEVDCTLDLVVVEVDVMQHEYFGPSGWQRALFLDADGYVSDLDTCDLHLDPEGWTVHRYADGDLLRITAAGLVSNENGQRMLAPTLKRFDRTGRRVWVSRRINGAIPNRAREEGYFDFNQPLPRTTEYLGISQRGARLIVETDSEIAVIDTMTGRRVRARTNRGPRMQDTPSF